MGIEPTCSAWKADILPLNYTRGSLRLLHYIDSAPKSQALFLSFYKNSGETVKPAIGTASPAFVRSRRPVSGRRVPATGGMSYICEGCAERGILRAARINAEQKPRLWPCACGKRASGGKVVRPPSIRCRNRPRGGSGDTIDLTGRQFRSLPSLNIPDWSQRCPDAESVRSRTRSTL